MRYIRIVFLGLMFSTGLVSGANAHGPQVGLSVNLGYPVYAVPPVFYAPPPPVYIAPPSRIYYGPPPPLVYVPPYRYAGYYGYDHGSRRGWHNHRHHRH